MSGHGFEALPPSDLAWQIGKTAASIAFVSNAEYFISNSEDQDKINLLRKAVDQIKSGELVIQNWLSPEQYLDQK